MTQLVQLHENYDKMKERGIHVIAIAQEDTDLKKHGQIKRKLPDDISFDIVADLNRKETGPYHRTTAYYIDPEGIVRQVFPMIIHARPSWDAIIAEFDRINAN